MQFNTTFQIKNTLLRNAIVNTKSRAKQIIEYFLNSTVYFSYVTGKLNPADYLSKLFLDPIQAVNSSLWRYGADLLSHEDSYRGDIFYKVNISGDVFLGEVYPVPSEGRS